PAVSLVLVARSTQYAAAENVPGVGLVYPTNSALVWADPIWGNGGTLTWAGATATTVNLDLSSNAGITTGTWQNYRYKLYETVASLRNVTWVGWNYTASGSYSC